MRMRRFPEPALKKFSKEFAIFKKLNSPRKIQDFLYELRINFERKHSTLRSPLMVLQREEAQCVEGAMLAAAILWYHGKEPLLLDLVTTKDDHGHVVALFKEGNRWGPISKPNHSFLRYPVPIYKNFRAIALSY